MHRYLIPSTSTLPRNPHGGGCWSYFRQRPWTSQRFTHWLPSPIALRIKSKSSQLFPGGPGSPTQVQGWGTQQQHAGISQQGATMRENMRHDSHTRPHVWSQYTKNLDHLWKGKCQCADKHFKRILISPLYTLKAKTKRSQTATWSLFSKCYFLIRKFTQQQINLKDRVNKTPFCGNL